MTKPAPRQGIRRPTVLSSRRALLTVAMVASVLLTGCDRPPDAAESSPPATVTSTIAPITVVSTAPAVTTTVRETRTVTTGAPPTTVTVRVGAATPTRPSDGSSDSLTWWTCDRLVQQAAKTSAETGQKPVLLKVRAPSVEQDNRKTVKKPTGDGTSIVLACKGTGMWSSGPDHQVTVSLSIDADGDLMISYRSRSF